MANDYIYAVARIRSRELALFDEAFMEELLNAQDEAHCLQMLNEHGWGESGMTAEEIFAGEEKKIWDLMKELVGDLSVFDVFLYENDFHNLKAAVKEVCLEGTHEGIFMDGGTVDPETMMTALREQNYKELPEWMQDAAKEAMELLLTTRDGQLCDCIIDRACLEAVQKAGRATDSEIMALYGELKSASGDINIAYRAGAAGKDKAFLNRALAETKTLDKASLAQAAVEGREALFNYLRSTPYSDAVQEMEESPAALERWADNLMMRRIRPQIQNSFGIDPLVAYVLARRNEIKTVRIILTGKRNEMPEEVIRGRIRETYV